MTASACTFFEEPIDDLGSIPAPSDAVPAIARPLPTETAPTAESKKPAAAVQNSAQKSSSAYLTVATLFDIPEEIENLSFVHFITNNGTRRAQAVCEAFLATYPVTDVAKVPANTEHLIVWPVSLASSGANCNDMISDYEPIDISNETAKNIKESSSGPVLLTKNTPASKRLIFDLSSVKSKPLTKSLKQWEGLVGSNAGSWPKYQSAN